MNNGTESKPSDITANYIAEAAKNTRRLYWLYLFLISYSVVTVVGTKDNQIVFRNEAVRLPILDVDVSLTGFFIFAPILLTLMFMYFQFYLLDLKDSISKLRNNFAKPDIEIYPWIVISVDNSTDGLIPKLKSITVKAIVWFTLPFTLILFSAWYVKKHDPTLSYIVTGIYPVVGTLLVVIFWCRYDNVPLRAFYKSPFKLILISIVFLLQATLITSIPLSNNGYCIYIGKFWSSCIDLSYQKLINEPTVQYESTYWGDFRNIHLEGANLRASILKKADLRSAHLENAYLGFANLEGADLTGANLNGADLVRANLNKANLTEADLRGADLSEATVNNANLYCADLENSYLFGTDLEGSDLSLTSFVNADLGERIRIGIAKPGREYTVNLRNAYLGLANMRGGNLIKANFEGADIWGVNLSESDLRGAKHLTIEQLSKVGTLFRAKLDQPLVKELKRLYPNLLDKPENGGQVFCPDGRRIH
jgi:uncharacterized protein YjbI with pentapeptide repeats